jgi:hypothetical protein
VVLSEGMRPNLQLTGGGVVAVVGLVALAAAGLYLYSQRQRIGQALAQGADQALGLVNPADDRNAAYRAASAIGGAITGREDWTLGGQLADWFPSAAERELNEQLRPAPKPDLPEPDPYGAAPYYAP